MQRIDTCCSREHVDGLVEMTTRPFRSTRRTQESGRYQVQLTELMAATDGSFVGRRQSRLSQEEGFSVAVAGGSI